MLNRKKDTLLHPDQLLESLRREAERFPDRRADIEKEIRRVEGLPRPETAPEDPVTLLDPRVEYLRALEREKGRTDRTQHGEIEAEIARTKAEIRSGSVTRAVSPPDVKRRGRPPKNPTDAAPEEESADPEENEE